MRPIDPRLLGRARAARTLLVVDVALGVAMALLVLAGATLAGPRRRPRVRRRVAASDRPPPRAAGARVRGARARSRGASRSPAAAPRPACSPSCGSRSSSGGCAASRPRSTAPRARSSRPPPCRASTALETLLRPLPAPARAGLHRAARGASRGWRRSTSSRRCVMLADAAARAGVHVADRPLRPSSAARERWQALRLLSTHFLDVVRGLPTLRAFNRGEAQTAAIARVGDALPADDDGHAARRASSPARCSSWRRRSASRSSR